MQTEALVLDVNDHGESDLIVTLFSREHGRLTVIAKGGRKSKKRFVNKLEIFTFLHVTCAPSRSGGLGMLEEAEIHAPFLSLRFEPERYMTGSVVREFLLLNYREGAPDEEAFRLSLWTLHAMDSGKPARACLALFLVRLFGLIGYRPVLDRCGGCATPVSPGNRYFLDAGRGLLICSRCSPHSGHRPQLSPGTLKMLQAAQRQPLEQLARLLPRGTVLEESLQFLHQYGKHLLQRDVSSWLVMDSYLRSAGGPQAAPRRPQLSRPQR